MNTPFIVAEISANHLGSMARALKIVDAAYKAGADAVKLQTYTPESMVADHAYMLPSGPWKGRQLIELYREAQTPTEWHKPIFDHARGLGLIPFSSPFDAESVDLLESLDCPIYKVASFELVDIPLISYIARTRKPMILSTGMATVSEIETAVETAKSNGCNNIVLLKCTSAYPAPTSDANLATMQDMMSYFGRSVGLSDHTSGIGVAVAATLLGASVIEKHLTLSRADGGPDAKFSMEPHEFASMVTECHRAAESIGFVKYGPSESEMSSVGLRRSLYFSTNKKAGQEIGLNDIHTARVAIGLTPKDINLVIGRRVSRNVYAGQPVTMEAF